MKNDNCLAGKAMKILITGSSGFVGRNVTEYLQAKEKYELVTPSSKELNCIDEDSVSDFLKKNKFDCIMHFAVYGNAVNKNRNADKILEYNLRIFYNFYNNRQYFGKMYYTGSGAEYDKKFPIVSVSERQIGEHLPTDQYGLMKYIVGQLIDKSSNIYNLRLFGIFGKYEYYPQKFISNVCCKAIKGIPLSIRQNVYFDYLWVEDFCRILELLINKELNHHTYNIVSGQKISLKEICKIVNDISGKELPVYIGKNGFANEYTGNNERFMREFPNFKYTPTEHAVRELYLWYEENKNNIDMYNLLYP